MIEYSIPAEAENSPQDGQEQPEPDEDGRPVHGLLRTTPAEEKHCYAS